jgi:hypothetical protein
MQLHQHFQTRRLLYISSWFNIHKRFVMLHMLHLYVL